MIKVNWEVKECKGDLSPEWVVIHTGKICAVVRFKDEAQSLVDGYYAKYGIKLEIAKYVSAMVL